MKKIAFLGGTSGLGQETSKYLVDKYNVDIVSSSRVDFERESSIDNYFFLNKDVDVLVIFNNYNYNSFLHKYNDDNIDELNKQIQINVNGITYTISSALKQMREKGYGRIILASSVTVDKTVLGTGVYAASKAYLETLVKTIALENASKGITANCIQLGYMDGGLTYTINDNLLKEIVKSIPAKRLGTCEEIYKTIDFIIENEYINGSTIKLTGGL